MVWVLCGSEGAIRFQCVFTLDMDNGYPSVPKPLVAVFQIPMVRLP